MRGHWLNFEDKQSQKSIMGNACNPKIVSIEITLLLLLAGITMSLSGCGGGPLRAYYYQDDQHYRYYETKADEVLLVSPDGKVGNATYRVRGKGYPSLNERGELVWNNGLKPEPVTLLDVGVVKWNADTADWDMAGYEIAPETGLCRVNALMWIPWFNESYADRPHDPFYKRRSCWHLVWAIPTWIVVDAFFLVGVPVGVMSGGG